MSLRDRHGYTVVDSFNAGASGNKSFLLSLSEPRANCVRSGKLWSPRAIEILSSTFSINAFLVALLNFEDVISG